MNRLDRVINLARLLGTEFRVVGPDTIEIKKKCDQVLNLADTLKVHCIIQRRCAPAAIKLTPAQLRHYGISSTVDDSACTKMTENGPRTTPIGRVALLARYLRIPYVLIDENTICTKRLNFKISSLAKRTGVNYLVLRDSVPAKALPELIE